VEVEARLARCSSFKSRTTLAVRFDCAPQKTFVAPLSAKDGENMATAPKSEILDMVELVSYQDGSVVSRQITKAEAGNVTLFAFDQDQELSEHTAPFDALVHILDGDAEIKISGKAFHLKTGQAIIMPADEPHALKALTRFKMLLTMIRN
jgi:quercetin dioxygenase-like cupin family protein